jgi:hypothetical protein
MVISNDYSERCDPDRAIRYRRSMVDRLRRSFFIAATAATLLGSTGDVASAATFRQGVSAFNRQQYLLAAQNFFLLAEQGDRTAWPVIGKLCQLCCLNLRSNRLHAAFRECSPNTNSSQA